MTFADKYSKHAYADLIREAETQGIGLGVQAERERIIALLEAWLADDSGDFDATLALIKGDEPSIIQDNNLNYIMGDDK